MIVTTLSEIFIVSKHHYHDHVLMTERQLEMPSITDGKFHYLDRKFNGSALDRVLEESHSGQLPLVQ